MYTLTDAMGKKNNLDYKIVLQTKPSNLGKGDVLYFVCPQSGNLCRVLYRAYSSHIWKSRASFSYRIYYPLQISSKLNRYNDRYWELENELEKLYKKKGAYTYKGKLTKRVQRIARLETECERMDILRWSSLAMPVSLRKALMEI